MIAPHVKRTPMGYLMALMQLQGASSEFEAVCCTSDGHYMAQETGDLGYNVFLGRPWMSPTEETSKKAQDIWNSLTMMNRIAVIELAAHPPDGSPILLEQFVGDMRLA